MGSARPRAVVFADSDSRWKWAAMTARQIAPDHAVDARFLRGDSMPSQRQIDEVGIVPDTSRVVSLPELVTEPGLAEADLLVLGVTGGSVLAVIHALGTAWREREHRPVVVTGYVGVVYENVVDGAVLRVGADIVLANSAADADTLRDIYAGVGADPKAVVESALPYLGGKRYDPEAWRRGERPFTVCFAVQPSVPASREERVGILAKAARHARLHPDREVLIKLRNRPGEGVTHTEAYSYEELFGQLADPPANLKLLYGEMGGVLDRTDLLVTVSSTAAMEAIHRSIPTGILTDFGIREAHGNHFFVSSGLLTSWQELDEGRLPTVAPGWAEQHGLTGQDPYREARDRYAALRGCALPPLRPWYTPERHGDYLGNVVPRRGIGLDGLPLAAGDPAGGRPGGRRWPGRLLRRGAGRVYRLARRRLGPALRRLAED
ncbi:DUF6716 putative glycosyltransferase [Streptomyces aidingensis]|uniref:Uncharacterized protein n=1 Tax=Streptomyces aidingensis TaxID=910347 RepID=A0A1I1GS93_9ACTN|nr:DUF6716 putative glycosyltransferase [Streptomyces aidingensis]SFC14657.1 hypothetical protein SAMN05421773_102121 [Streptomyces aidingensis]